MTRRSETSSLAVAWHRTASARLALLVLGALLSALVFISALFVWQANGVLTSQVLDSLGDETTRLSRTLSAGGLPALTKAIAARSEYVEGGLYLIEDTGGKRLSGNLQTFPDALTAKPDGAVFSYAADDGSTRAAVGYAIKLAEGRIVVARDIEDHLGLARVLRWSALLGFAVLSICGVVAGVYVWRTVLGRVEALRAASQRIVDGDLSERLPEGRHGDELDALARSLNDMIEQIGQLEDGIRDVSENIAHDLKTPLNRLRNRAEAALMDDRGAPAYRVGLEATMEAADEIIQTFNALLLIAKLEAGALDRSRDPVDLGAVVTDLCELYEPVAEEAGLGLRCVVQKKAIRPVVGNRQLIGQAISNLLDNAIKYSASVKRRETVCIEHANDGSCRHNGDVDVVTRPNASASEVCLTLSPDGSGVTVSVADRGPGIDEEDRERVLERFVRLEKSRSAPGTGLGLSLVVAVARLHGGSVALFDNRPGLRVELFLPFDAAVSHN